MKKIYIITQEKGAKQLFKKLYETKKKALEDYRLIEPTKGISVLLYQLNVINDYYDYMILSQKNYRE